jgi:PAS domain S-box-containing protein
MVKATPSEAMDGSSEGLESVNYSHALDQCFLSAVLAIDHQQRLTAFTAEAEKLTGLSRTQVLGRDAASLPTPLREIVQKTLKTGETIADRHILLPSPDGGHVTVRIWTTPMCSDSGKTMGAIAVMNNVTPARHLDQNLKRLDRLASIGTLSASMAHEVKNAMVAVKTFVDLLIKKNQGVELAGIVGREMRRIDSIVSQMLRFSGPAKPTFALVHLHAVIEESLSLVQHHLEGRKLALVTSLQASPDTLHGDAYQLEQAFINLFFNALEAMGSHGELNVATEILPAGGPENPHAPLLRATVRDTGIGVAPENLDRLFDPFFTTKPNGTGLGLPITRRIVHEHRGVITVSSQPHQGTTFTLLFPVATRQP